MAQVTITARDMYAAQGFKLDAETRALLVAKADRYRKITGETGPTDINVPVIDLGGALIGHLRYML
ncbi:hypothetical protein SEA_ROSIEPOSIE_102 [Arthrobacter phage RosiePosie]|uniref:Uncharacterized protein n=2 Tax=Klausavirus princesstrina TaxID=1984784 RepID=A0A286N3P0_9CAUD|nr:hypothetical protein SEA_ROSIEPOSIE_102 [Arthrobacter phage RosiePosie]ASZ73314.1 hypothetical protein SEA_JAYCOOKIE_103 [Arthrobacter phage JayCookie]